jgi:nucleoside-specific outer membrane channel protein Tsx
MSLLRVAGKKPRTAFVRDVSLTLGLNTGTRSTGPSPFVLLPGATTELNVPGFAFFSVGTFAYIDRGQFQGQPTECHGTTYQVTPSWSLPFSVQRARLRFDGYVDFIGEHAECASEILTMPQLKLDLLGFWGKQNRLYLSVKVVYWHNKYGIQDLQDKVVLPVLIWVLH